MTCIVGSVCDGVVMIGGDSAGVAGYEMAIRKDPKVFLVDNVAFGFTSSFRMGQLLQYSLRIPSLDPGGDIFRYMATEFVNAVRDCLKEGGYAKVDKNEEEGGSFLVGIRGRLFAIHSDFQVAERACGHDAVGCGESYALGSLYTYALDHYQGSGGRDQHGVLMDALYTAENFSAGVRGPFNFVSTTPEEVNP